MRKFIRMTALVAVIAALFVPAVAAADHVYSEPNSFNHPNFRDTWLGNELGWGPAYEPAAEVTSEEYSNAPGGFRAVQYFDKTRMEDNSYRASDEWRVTNGLLVAELVTGQMQVGDDQFVTCSSSDVHVAGDPGQSNPLSYGDFEDTFQNGAYSWDPAFAEFMSEPGRLQQVGLPSSEARTTFAPVNGVMMKVVVQLGERQALTYTEDNPEEHRVQFGNVGQHYYEWRYGDNGCDEGRTPVPMPPDDDVPVSHARGFDISERCEGFQFISGHEVCAIVSGNTGTAQYTSDGVVFTHGRSHLGEAAMVLLVRTYSGGDEAVQISGNDRMKIWFQENLEGSLICASPNDCRADDDGNAVVTPLDHGLVALYVGSIGPEGYQVTYTFGSAEELEGNVIDPRPYAWETWNNPQ